MLTKDPVDSRKFSDLFIKFVADLSPFKTWKRGEAESYVTAYLKAYLEHDYIMPNKIGRFELKVVKIGQPQLRVELTYFYGFNNDRSLSISCTATRTNCNDATDRLLNAASVALTKSLQLR